MEDNVIQQTYTTESRCSVPRSASPEEQELKDDSEDTMYMRKLAWLDTEGTGGPFDSKHQRKDSG